MLKRRSLTAGRLIYLHRRSSLSGSSTLWVLPHTQGGIAKDIALGAGADAWIKSPTVIC
jgi:hypothetical protein